MRSKSTRIPCEVLLNDGRGVFSPGSTLPGTLGGDRISGGDLDGDGDLDIGLFSHILGGFGSTRPYVLLNDGTARFSDITQSLPLPGPVTDYGIGQFVDIDQDGDLDILLPSRPVAVNGTEYLNIVQLINDGRGNFHDGSVGYSPTTTNSQFTRTWLLCADFDADGDLDVLTNDPVNSRAFSMLWNHRRQILAPSPPTLGQPWTLRVFADPTTVAVPVAGLRVGAFNLGALGVFGIDPATSVVGPGFALDASGVYDLQFQVPNDPRLTGLTLYWQCLFAEGTPTRLQLSNTWEQAIR